MPGVCAFVTTTAGTDVRSAARTHLTEDDIRTIRGRYAHGATQRNLAKDYGVSPATIQAIISGRNWKHVK